MIVRSHPRAANDNLSDISLTDRTLMGFAATLVGLIIVSTLIICGVIV